MSYDSERLAKTLKGQKILEVRGGKDGLLFVLSTSFVSVVPVGDCCSESWFEHLNGLDALIGAVAQDVQELEVDRELPSPDEHGQEHEFLQGYSYQIVTDKGRADLEMRNSSNGYYGGYLSVAELHFGDSGLHLRWTPLTEDF